MMMSEMMKSIEMKWGYGKTTRGTRLGSGVQVP